MNLPIIFDIDGTLLDSVDLHAQAWRDAFLEFGVDVPLGDVRSQIGKGGDQLLPVFLSEEQVSAIGKKLTDRRGEIWKEQYMSCVRPFPGVVPLFDAIAAHGRQIALASSAKEEELDEYKRILGIEKYLKTTTSSADAQKSKPHPDIFEAALQRLDSQAAVVVGDSPYDAIAAKKLNLQCVGVLCGGFEKQSLVEAGCSKIYENPVALLGNLESWMG